MSIIVRIWVSDSTETIPWTQGDSFGTNNALYMEDNNLNGGPT